MAGKTDLTWLWSILSNCYAQVLLYLFLSRVCLWIFQGWETRQERLQEWILLLLQPGWPRRGWRETFRKLQDINSSALKITGIRNTLSMASGSNIVSKPIPGQKKKENLWCRKVCHLKKGEGRVCDVTGAFSVNPSNLCHNAFGSVWLLSFHHKSSWYSEK